MTADDHTARPGRSWADRIVGSSGNVYGIILASSIVAALSYKERGNAWVMIGALLATELVFAFAHMLSALFEQRRTDGRFPSTAEIRSTLLYEWPMLLSTWPALALLTVAGIGLLSVDAAVNLVLIANAGILFAWGFAIARTRTTAAWPAIAMGVASAALGVVLVLLKLALH